MKYLLDTHAIIWFVSGSDKFSETAKEISEKEECYFSYASLWEIAIKQSLGKLDFPVKIPYLREVLENSGFKNLPITDKNLESLKSLPFIHHDPFDRLLIAQAQNNNLTIITKDSIILKYDIKVIW